MISIDRKLNWGLAHAALILVVMVLLFFYEQGMDGRILSRLSSLAANSDSTELKTTADQFDLYLKWRSTGHLMMLGGLVANLAVLALVYYKVHRESIGRLDALADLQQQKEEMNTLGGTVQFLQACRSADEIGIGLLPTTFTLFPGAVGRLYAIREFKDRLSLVASTQDNDDEEPIHVDDCWGLREGKAHQSRGPRIPGRCSHLDPESSWGLCLPLVARGELLGMLTLERVHAPQNPGRAMDLAILLSEQVGMALANLKLRETLENQSMRDPLTGLFNRRFFDDALRRETSRSRRKGRPLSLAMIDIDHFKEFNDRFGHDAGDEILASVGVMLQDSARAGDIVSRYGGEEFTVLLPDTDLDSAAAYAQHVRVDLAGRRFFHHGRRLPPVTLSIGLSEYPKHGLDGSAAVKAADMAMYRAKEEGRNQVKIAQSDQPALSALQMK